MNILPALDLKNGQCVRLKQGDFKSAKIYTSDPLTQAEKFMKAGANWIHIVDLDGAKSGTMQQFDLIEQVATKTALKIQVGGGIRDTTTIKKLLNAGAERVVIGSLAVEKKQLVQKWLGTFGPERLVLAFDVMWKNEQPEILTRGWQSSSRQILWDVFDSYAKSGLRHVLCTDISRDGMLSGPNIHLYRRIKQHAPMLDVIASGGVSSITDLIALAEGAVRSVVVGKAIYEGRIDLERAIKQVQNAC